MATRVFLTLSVLIWLPYGLFCFYQPGYLAGAAGVAASTPTGTVELRAMYGGLQAAIGALALAGVLRPALRQPALVALVFLTAGLGVSRLAGAVGAAELSAYTGLALVFELTSASVGAWLLGREAGEAAAG